LEIGDNIKNNNKKGTNYIGDLPPSNKFVGDCP